MSWTFITLTKPFAFRGDLLLKKEGKSPISNFFLEKRSKKSANPLYLLGFIGIPPSTNLHLLFGIFCFAKTTCSYSSLLQVFARVEQQIKRFQNLAGFSTQIEFLEVANAPLSKIQLLLIAMLNEIIFSGSKIEGAVFIKKIYIVFILLTYYGRIKSTFSWKLQ